MNNKIYLIIAISCHTTSYAGSIGHTPLCNQSENVNFIISDIFDLDDPDTALIHRWANFFHIKTHEYTIINESAFFLKKCQIEKEDVDELERYLRQRKYIREAKVTLENSGKFLVETWDNWSLMPTIDFGRKGGVNKYSIGVKDRNLLGLGIDSEIEYFSNNQRSGYKFDASFPLYLNKNMTASVRLTSSDDGDSSAFYLDKKFVSFDTKNAYKIGIDEYKQIDTQFQNGITSAEYNHEKSLKTIQWKWLLSDTNDAVIRYGLGYNSEKHIFTEITENSLIHSNFIPENRHFNFPFLTFEYLQKDYQKLTNLNLINQIEDFNLGWHISTMVGSDFSSSLASPDVIFSVSSTTGFKISSNSYLFFDTKYEGENYSNSRVKDRYLLSFITEYFHKINSSWGAYLKNTNVLSRNQFLDRPVELGDDSGVRGYPLQYQHGERTTQLTAELRYYPHINIYKLFELGGAAFFDAGKAFGESPVINVNNSFITSIGVGARFYSPHSSEAQVIHVDLVKPLSPSDVINSVEIRISTKHSF